MTKAELLENPIRRARVREGKTLSEFADDCGVHLQAVYLNEQGVYPDVLPAIISRLSELEYTISTVRTEYREFQERKRRNNGDHMGLDRISLGPPELDAHPFIAFRVGLVLSRLGFAKCFCVHPASLYQLENGKAVHLPEQLREALKQAGLPGTVIEELDSRSEEYSNGGWQPFRAADSGT